MYQAKYQAEGARRSTRRNKKAWLLLIAVAAMLLAVVGGTVAYLVTRTNPKVNTFTPSKVACLVEETFKNNVKSNVQVKNTGDTAAYLRAAVLVTWQDASGNVLGTAPVAGQDYSITMPASDKWAQANDGFWYYSEAVAPGAYTEALIGECKPLKAAPQAGYTLHVEIVASAIQSTLGTNAQAAWAAAQAPVVGE